MSETYDEYDRKVKLYKLNIPENVLDDIDSESNQSEEFLETNNMSEDELVEYGTNRIMQIIYG